MEQYKNESKNRRRVVWTGLNSEHDNELSGSIKSGEFLDQLGNYLLLSKYEFLSLELIS
jgi:hypothetical protein